MSQIIITGNNVVPNGRNSEFIYNFPNSVNLAGCEICVQSVTIFYSWFNISAATYNNNQFSYSWLDASGTGYTAYPIVIPDGLYSIQQIYEYAQYTMIENGHYATQTNSDGTLSNVFYWDMVINETLYAVQVNTFSIPTTAPAGVTYQFTAPVQQFNPVLTFPANFCKIVGFTPSFTTTTSNAGTTLSFTSSIAPEVQPSPSLLLSVSGVNNIYSQPPNILFCLSPTVSVGAQFYIQPYPMYCPLLGGLYSQLRLAWLNTSFQSIPIQDSNCSIVLVIRKIGTQNT